MCSYLSSAVTSPPAGGRHDRPDDRAWRTHNGIGTSHTAAIAHQDLVVARWLWIQKRVTIGRVDVVVEVR